MCSAPRKAHCTGREDGNRDLDNLSVTELQNGAADEKYDNQTGGSKMPSMVRVTGGYRV